MSVITSRRLWIGTAFTAAAGVACLFTNMVISRNQDVRTVQKAFLTGDKAVTLNDGNRYGVIATPDGKCMRIAAHQVVTMDMNQNPATVSTVGIFWSRVCS